ncbi:DUF5818 domain-containing protein [Sphingomonas sp. Leaf257]|uniref:DUF5818 domain-containing protein n=1 Tax=Sphingomonas sp. Leaf257 TaxID=1736309 RepID=UPI0009EB841F|nr:DUF5818 domain-containing protein [Sphingomonas sp. Leaf257]
MRTGSHHTVTGWLNIDAGRLVLRPDGGGRWRLDVGLLTRWRCRHLIGKRVCVTGIRDEFDLLAVQAITPPDAG